MSKIEVVKFDLDEVYSVVRKNLLGCICDPKEVPSDGYNCNFSIEDVPSALRHGLLTKRERIRMFEGRELTEDEEFRFADPRCVNGADAVSLSSLDLDFSKMYRNEDWYDPASGIRANFVISNDVRAGQMTTNYYNEFLSFKSILPTFIKAVDCRILRIKDVTNIGKISAEERIETMLSQYESLKEIASTMVELGMDIPLREVSTWKIDEIMDGGYMVRITEHKDGFITLDPEKVKDMPKLKIK